MTLSLAVSPLFRCPNSAAKLARSYVTWNLCGYGLGLLVPRSLLIVRLRIPKYWFGVSSFSAASADAPASAFFLACCAAAVAAETAGAAAAFLAFSASRWRALIRFLISVLETISPVTSSSCRFATLSVGGAAASAMVSRLLVVEGLPGFIFWEAMSVLGNCRITSSFWQMQLNKPANKKSDRGAENGARGSVWRGSCFSFPPLHLRVTQPFVEPQSTWYLSSCHRLA